MATYTLPFNSDVSESFLSSQSRVRVPRPSSQSHLKFFWVESELRPGRVESQELSSHFESLFCKLESMSSHTNFHVFPMTLFCY